MAFDLATAKITSGGFDVSTAQPEQELRPGQAATPMDEDFIPTQESFSEEEARRWKETKKLEKA